MTRTLIRALWAWRISSTWCEVGKGSTFLVRLPFGTPVAPEVPLLEEKGAFLL